MAERRDAVREAYESMGISRRDLAGQTGISPSTITNAIAGSPLSRAAAARIGAVIGWTADEVLAGVREINRDDDNERDDDNNSPQSAPPSRPSDETRRPPNRPNATATIGAA